jgi:hypothetical protein
MKGSAITGPVGKEAAELWPVCFTSSLAEILQRTNEHSSVSPPTPVSSCKVLFVRGSRLELFSCTSHIASRIQWAYLTHKSKISFQEYWAVQR